MWVWGIPEIGVLQEHINDRDNNIIEQIRTSNKARTIGERNHLIECPDRDFKIILINANIKGASTWLHSVNHSTVWAMSKLEFHDAMGVRYDLKRKAELKNVHAGEECNVTYALSCKTNVMTIIRQNNPQHDCKRTKKVD
ncbi:hypothetical protein GJ496_008374 [Pomphorhynchus laevis]|nr:hypothetical protein GJ496_008374 [Pomphorhynchus laevis]